MRPFERRQPRVSVQDLRRDLREADEDRYHLLVRTGDWRHSRIGVQEVRRQLREADEDRFKLTVRVHSLLRVIRRAGISTCLILAAAGALVFWNAKRADLPQVAGVSGVTAPGLTASNDISLSTPGVVASSPSSGPSARTAPSPSRAPRTPSPPIPTSAAAAPGVANHQRHVAAPSRKGVVTERKPESVRRLVPRPLHPGEFGRAL